MNHWGMPDDITALCGSASRQRCTTVRMVTCRFCQNIIDNRLHATPPTRETAPAPETRPCRCNHPLCGICRERRAQAAEAAPETLPAGTGEGRQAERMFPVLFGNDARKMEEWGSPREVPWSLLAPHEEWAQRNHSQSLEKLASRGGLGVSEMLAIIEHRPGRTIGPESAEQVAKLKALLAPTIPQQTPERGGAEDPLWKLAAKGNGAGSTLLHNYLTVERGNGGLDWRAAALEFAHALNRMHDVANKATALQCPSVAAHLDAVPERGGRTAAEECADVVAYLRRWCEVRPSIAGHFADEFEAGKHIGAAAPRGGKP